MEFLAAAPAASPQLDWTDFAWLAFSISIFTYLVRRVYQPGGDAVDTSHYGRAESSLALVLCGWFLAQGIFVFMNAEPSVTPQFTMTDIAFGVLIVLVFVAVVILVLKQHHASLNLLFGFSRQPIWKALILALILMLAAYPLVLAGSLLTQSFSKGPDDLQELVKFFRTTGRASEKLAVVFSAAIVAPFAEELFFRGIIYGVAKRYGGMTAALVFNAAFFAVIHGSLPIIGPLFVLAVCLTLAYEFTGSLWVPIFMHACFNAGELALMLLDRAKP